MRITPRDKWNKRAVLPALAALVVFVALLLRRASLVGFLGLKILGHPALLDRWEGPVHRKTVHHAGIQTDVYEGRRSFSPILIVHGLNPTGKDSVDLVRISEALAQAGYQVFVPDFEPMRRQHLLADQPDRIKSVFQFIGKDAAIACFSYGCGPAIIAAADPEIRDHLRFALAFGGYFDLREALKFVVTGPETEIGYLKWVYLAANSDLAPDPEDRERLQALAEHHLSDSPLDETAVMRELSAPAKALFDVFAASDPQDFEMRLRQSPESLRRRLAVLSPSEVIQSVHAPLILVHSINDPVIPAEQTVELAEAARKNGLAYSLTLLRIYGHVNPIFPEVSLTTLISFYLPETFRFLSVVNQVVARM